MIESYRQLMGRLRNMPLQRVCVAAAGDETVLQTIRDALDEGIAGAVLVGDECSIWKIARNISLDLNKIDLIHEPDDRAAIHTAYGIVNGGGAGVLMKGRTSIPVFFREVAALKGPGGAVLSCLAAYEIPGHDKLVYVTDGLINENPDFDKKNIILKNAVSFLESVGIDKPKVAVLSANEKVSVKMPVTVEAQKLASMFGKGRLGDALVEGPMALDVAISREAARQKGIKSPVASRADLLFASNLEVGHFLGKSIVHFARGKTAAVVLGAGKPVVLAEKTETSFGRLCSLALACYSEARMNNNMV